MTIKELKSKSRKQSIVKARNMAMYLARRLTDATLSEIGSMFNRHYGTVLHGIESVNGDRQQILRAQYLKEQLEKF